MSESKETEFLKAYVIVSDYFSNNDHDDLLKPLTEIYHRFIGINDFKKADATDLLRELRRPDGQPYKDKRVDDGQSKAMQPGNFTKVSYSEWSGLLQDIRSSVPPGKMMECVKCLSFATIAMDPETRKVYMFDHIGLVVEKISFEALSEIHMSIYHLATNGIHYREGFYDRSLNTEMFASITKATFLIGHLEFTWPELLDTIAFLQKVPTYKLKRTGTENW